MRPERVSLETVKAGRFRAPAGFFLGVKKGVASGRVFDPPLSLREDSAIIITLMFQNLRRRYWRAGFPHRRLLGPRELPHSGLSLSCGGEPCSLGAFGPISSGITQSRRLKSSTDNTYVNLSVSVRQRLFTILLNKLYHFSRIMKYFFRIIYNSHTQNVWGQESEFGVGSA